jgi:hypothetical protein
MAGIDKRVIILNGPPYSGKDTGANAIAQYVLKHAPWITLRQEKMVEHLKRGVHSLFNVTHTPEYIDKMQLKDTPYAELLGKTPREAYISASEDWLKPVFGSDVLGRMMLMLMKKAHNVSLHIFSDGGFVDEWVPIIDFVGARNVLLIHLSATDKSFAGDSRGYIGDDLLVRYPKMQRVRIHNDISTDPTDRELFRVLCCGAAKKFLRLDHED